MNRRGVTLIELLIAITLVAFLTLGIMFAMRLGLDAMGRSNQRLMSNRRVLGVDRIMHEQLASLMPVKAACAAAIDAQPTPVPFFQGDPQTLRFATAYSLTEAARGFASVVEYQVIPGENGEGVRLIVNQFVYAGPRAAGAACIGVVGAPDGPVGRYRPVVAGEGSFVLADRLAGCRFVYKEVIPDPPFERWVPEWRRAHLPAAVRLEMSPLDLDSAKLQVLPVTVPVRIDRDLMVDYEN